MQATVHWRKQGSRKFNRQQNANQQQLSAGRSLISFGSITEHYNFNGHLFRQKNNNSPAFANASTLPARLMRYRPTPLNILSGLLLGFAIYSAIRPGPMGFGFLAFWFLLPLGCLGLLADFLLQKFQKSYIRTFTIELLFIGIVAFGYSWTQRTKTFIIHDKLSSIYIVTIYGVDTAPKLPLDFLTWNYEIKIPDNGILLTSSNFTSDLPETEMKTYSGIKLNSENTELGFIRFSEDEINCNGKKYKYRSWMIDRHCCMYSSKDVDTLKVRLQNQICRQSQAGNIGFVQVGQDVVTSAICRHQQ